MTGGSASPTCKAREPEANGMGYLGFIMGVPGCPATWLLALDRNTAALGQPVGVVMVILQIISFPPSLMVINRVKTRSNRNLCS